MKIHHWWRVIMEQRSKEGEICWKYWKMKPALDKYKKQKCGGKKLEERMNKPCTALLHLGDLWSWWVVRQRLSCTNLIIPDEMILCKIWEILWKNKKWTKQKNPKPPKCGKHWTKLNKEGHVYAVLQHFQALSPDQTTKCNRRMNANCLKLFVLSFSSQTPG